MSSPPAASARTHDDITAECIARAFGVKLVLNDEIRQMMLKRYPPGGLNEARLRMAHTPEGARWCRTRSRVRPVSAWRTSSSWPACLASCRACSTPSAQLNGGPPILSRTVNCPLPEGVVAKGLGEIQARHPELDIGSYPTFGRGTPETNLVLRGTDSAKLADAVGEIIELVRSLGGKPTEQ